MRTGSACALALVASGACSAGDQALSSDDAAVVSDAALDGGADPDWDGDYPEGDGSGHVAQDSDCDLNGLWIARQNTESLALSLPQYANNWYYLELAQDGEEVVVTEHLDCGIEVRGTVLIQLVPATTRALMEHNIQVGRKGRFARQADGSCAFSMETFWSVRGVSEALYVPEPRNRSISLEALRLENPLPSRDMASASEDWDDDGQPGVAWQVSGISNGARHSAQRDWTRWYSTDDYRVPAARDFAEDLIVRAEFSNEEVVYAADNPTLGQVSTPNAEAQHTLTLRFLGRTRADPRARALLKADAFETCLAVQKALPSIMGLR